MTCQRATAPEESFGLQPSQLRLQAQNVSATPALKSLQPASTMAQRLLKVVTAVGPLPAFGSLKQSSSARENCLRSPSARGRPSLAQRSFALKPTQLQLSRQTLLRLNSLQLQRSASASE